MHSKLHSEAVFWGLKMTKTPVFTEVFVWCGKQDLKSETAVNNVQLCIIWFDYKTDLHNNSKYHAL